MKKKTARSENYLLRVPVRSEGLSWSTGEDGLVTLAVENTGLMNRIAQKLLHKPRTSYIHLDRTGSFTWRQVDGQKDIAALGELVEAEFGAEAHPLYERLAAYFQVLDSYRFIHWVN